MVVGIRSGHMLVTQTLRLVLIMLVCEIMLQQLLCVLSRKLLGCIVNQVYIVKSDFCSQTVKLVSTLSTEGVTMRGLSPSLLIPAQHEMCNLINTSSQMKHLRLPSLILL